MKAYTLMFALVCLNLAAFSINMIGIFPVSRELYISPFDIYYNPDPANPLSYGSGQFSLVMFAIIGAGGLVIGILGFILRSYILGAGAILIWVIGFMLPIAQWLLGGMSIMMGMLLPAELAWFSWIVGAFSAMVFFMFLVEIAAGRQIT